MRIRNKIYFRNKNISAQLSFHMNKDFLAGGQSDSSTYLGYSEIRSVTYFLLKKKPYLSD